MEKELVYLFMAKAIVLYHKLVDYKINGCGLTIYSFT